MSEQNYTECYQQISVKELNKYKIHYAEHEQYELSDAYIRHSNNQENRRVRRVTRKADRNVPMSALLQFEYDYSTQGHASNNGNGMHNEIVDVESSEGSNSSDRVVLFSNGYHHIKPAPVKVANNHQHYDGKTSHMQAKPFDERFPAGHWLSPNMRKGI